MNAVDRFEEDTAELPVVSEEDEQRAIRRRRITPPGFIPATASAPSTCTDPDYVRYLERQVVALQTSEAGARSVMHIVAEHNAELTEQARVLADQLQESERRRMELLEELLTLRP